MGLSFCPALYITLAPWAIRGRLAVPSRTKRQARLSVGQHRESNPGLRALRLDLRRASSGALTRTASALPPHRIALPDFHGSPLWQVLAAHAALIQRSFRVFAPQKAGTTLDLKVFSVSLPNYYITLAP